MKSMRNIFIVFQMSEPSSTIVIGAPATGAKFWPRKDITDALTDGLQNDHIIFPGPRRTGKTSVLLNLRATFNPPGRAVLINAEKCSNPTELIQGIAKELSTPDLKNRAGKILKSGASMIKGLKLGIFGVDFNQAAETDWGQAAGALLQALIEEQNPVLIMIDEFSVFVNSLARRSPAEAEKMLRWFREWRQRLVDTKVRFLLTGSIGIDTVLRRLNLGDTVNDCRPIEMSPPTSDVAREFLLARAKENDIPVTDETVSEVLRLIDPHWYYPLQIFLVEIQTWARRNGREPALDDLRGIYEDELVRKGNENLKHMWDKLSEIFDPLDARFAEALLKDLSKNSIGFSRDEMQRIHLRESPTDDPGKRADFSFVLNVLRHDGYLIQDTRGEQRTRFASNLLRDYWSRQHA
jgi:uncharacterized protein